MAQADLSRDFAQHALPLKSRQLARNLEAANGASNRSFDLCCPGEGDDTHDLVVIGRAYLDGLSVGHELSVEKITGRSAGDQSLGHDLQQY